MTGMQKTDRLMPRAGKGGRFRGIPFILLGLVLVCAGVILVLYNGWDSDRAGKASQEIVDQLDQIIGEAEPVLKLPNFTEKPDQEMPTEEIDGYLYIGVLELPAIDRRLPVMEEWDYERLRISPCRYEGSYFTDDLVICAHNYERHFSPIKSIDLGADVYFTTVDGVVYHYVVTNRETVEPTHVDEMIDNSSGDWQLSLFTCNTGGQTRCAVRCQRVD